MTTKADFFTEEVLRKFTKFFTARDIHDFLLESGVRVSVNDVKQLLEANPIVFPLEKNFYISRAGAFTDQYFSIKLTPSEYAKGIFIPGDRCIPFVDSEMYSSSLDFMYKGKRLKNKTAEFESDQAIDMFILYGEEYASQYIAADPANADMDLVDQKFTLPNSVLLTGVDITPLKQKDSFQLTDRLLCRVKNWDMGQIEISVVHEAVDGNVFDTGTAGDVRLHWYTLLEQFLLESFNRLGPGSSIEEQLAKVFFEHRRELCIPECGSVKEFLDKYSKKISVEFFGVETRLWHKGEPVPAIGSWNKSFMNGPSIDEKEYSFLNRIIFDMPDFILDQYICDMYFRRSDNLAEVLERMIPEKVHLTPLEKDCLLLHLQKRNDILHGGYNWFADQVTGTVRQKALLLYTRVSYLVDRIDGMGKSLESFPQQELVILSQLFNHVTRILESVSKNEQVEENSEALLMSLEGMELNFEDISCELEYAVSEQKKSRFTIVK